ncbi:AraC family transcriptional regulator [Xylophilus sp.]|uniref:AraC family transcriptional regulator n=1 Tax=Xylophilus sp. TaxID=2653893 RepID=UPI0013B9F587|nr:helix-turn-helix transcriptional regulator [Xylophilus sp.]KAF1049791.1 MAG: HTH-type transcriptional regulator NimR [Xylophilus sp.]
MAGTEAHPGAHGEEIPLYPFFGGGRSLVFAHDYPASSAQPQHRHDVAQLLHAVRGVMRVTTPGGYWVVPPGRGMWIPAWMPHAIHMVGPVSMCTLYVAAHAMPAPCEACAVVVVPALLQRLLGELALHDPRDAAPPGARQRAMEDLLLIEIAGMEQLPLHVALPADARLLRLCEEVLARPQDARTLEDHADRVGASPRTLRRLFQQQLGMGFGAWRQQVRLMEALAKLAEREPVAKVAADLGYAAPSAFIAMFRRSMGRSPRGYLPESAADPPAAN